MKIQDSVLSTFVCGFLALPGIVFAQSEQTPESLLDEPATEVVEESPVAAPAEAPASDVVDVSEENFRRSMELRDREQQRSPDLTTGSYSRSTGLQALAGLPEESQKHLREQLREVIVESGPWTPEDAGTLYPFVPSEQAEKNGSLEKREEVAWGEMVSEYHEREAAIHANAGRTQAATARGGDSGQNSQGESGQSQQGEQGQQGKQDSQQAQSGAEAARAERAEALTQMLNSPDAGHAESGGGQSPSAEAGTEQNALELLTNRKQIPARLQQPDNTGQGAPAASEQLTQTATHAQEKDAGRENQEVSVELDSDDVIAIEDLNKIKVDPHDSDNN